MKSFNILDHNERIHESRFLEASAGTGKTFAIEHLVSRLLIEDPKIPLNKILVVTFTRAATRDLKLRIRKCLENGIHSLKESNWNASDYLKAIEDKAKALKAMEEALFGFDEAQIFTIHGFCARALRENTLEGDISLEMNAKECSLDEEIYQRIIQDFFRSGQAVEVLGQPKIDVLMESYKGRFYELEKDLLKEIKQRVEFAVIPNPITSEEIFCETARHCQGLVKKYLANEELAGPDELLGRMVKATANPEFRKNLRSKYSAAIIDEFQDTDPDQWTIFERLFLSKNEDTIPVYLVGDPKQSIYAFRQADIYTYLEAGKSLGEDARASLDTNYRSKASLVNALNTLFANCPAFMSLPRTNEELKYTAVKPSPDARNKTFKDSLGSIHFVKYKGENAIYNYIANAIALLSQRDQISFKEIAVLVKDRTEGEKIKAFLKTKNIPAVHHKSKSIAEANAIKDWKEILQAALSPRKIASIKAAMGSPIIGWTLSDIAELSDLNKIVELLAQWQSLGQSLQFSVGSFLNDFLRLSWRPNEPTNAEKMIRRLNGLEYYQEFLHIGELLLEHQSETKTSGLRLLSFLDDLSDAEVQQNDALKCRIDPTLDAVNIMTTHASKGLEFDIVFALGLNSSKPFKGNVFPIYGEDKICLHPANEDHPGLEKYLEEMDAEKMRQLYVAMTRPRYRLYMPYIVPKKTPELGSAAAIHLFLARLGNHPANWKDIYQKIQSDLDLHAEAIFKELSQQCDLTYESMNDIVEAPGVKADPPQLHLLQPAKVEVPGTPYHMLSFTALAKHTQAGDVKSILDVPHDYHAIDKTPYNLPSGADTGNLIHKLLETIPFNLIKNSKSSESLIPWIKSRTGGGIFKGWEKTIADIIFGTFNVPLTSPYHTFTLSQIDPQKTFKEIEFLYPFEGGCLKGFIDCVIEYEGRCYILDWKSNWLGSAQEYYTETCLDLAMKENQYDLQARIYTEAWKRYSQHMLDKPFEDSFGGVFYIFVRGPAVHYHNPAEVIVCKA